MSSVYVRAARDLHAVVISVVRAVRSLLRWAFTLFRRRPCKKRPDSETKCPCGVLTHRSWWNLNYLVYREKYECTYIRTRARSIKRKLTRYCDGIKCGADFLIKSEPDIRVIHVLQTQTDISLCAFAFNMPQPLNPSDTLMYCDRASATEQRAQVSNITRGRKPHVCKSVRPFPLSVYARTDRVRDSRVFNWETM